MSTVGIVVTGIVVLVVVLVRLEGRRQERIYGKGSERSAMAAGMLELQRHLEPERKVEVVLEEREEDGSAEAGSGPGGSC